MPTYTTYKINCIFIIVCCYTFIHTRKNVIFKILKIVLAQVKSHFVKSWTLLIVFFFFFASASSPATLAPLLQNALLPALMPQLLLLLLMLILDKHKHLMWQRFYPIVLCRNHAALLHEDLASLPQRGLHTIFLMLIGKRNQIEIIRRMHKMYPKIAYNGQCFKVYKALCLRVHPNTGWQRGPHPCSTFVLTYWQTNGACASSSSSRQLQKCTASTWGPHCRVGREHPQKHHPQVTATWPA